MSRINSGIALFPADGGIRGFFLRSKNEAVLDVMGLVSQIGRRLGSRDPVRIVFGEFKGGGEGQDLEKVPPGVMNSLRSWSPWTTLAA